MNAPAFSSRQQHDLTRPLSYREWHNELRTRQMAKALREAGARLDDTADVDRILRAANFTDDCIERLAADAANTASAHARPLVA